MTKTTRPDSQDPAAQSLPTTGTRGDRIETGHRRIRDPLENLDVPRRPPTAVAATDRFEIALQRRQGGEARTEIARVKGTATAAGSRVRDRDRDLQIDKGTADVSVPGLENGPTGKKETARDLPNEVEGNLT